LDGEGLYLLSLRRSDQIKGLSKYNEEGMNGKDRVGSRVGKQGEYIFHVKKKDLTNIAQRLDDNLETRTASAIRTPHLHFSHITAPHPFAQPAPEGLSSGLPWRVTPFEGVECGVTCSDVGGGRAGVDTGAVVEAVRGLPRNGEGVATAVLLEPAAGPLALSPMFGRSRISGVAYSGKTSLNFACCRFHE